MVVIDAELQEGEISHLAQAIQGAFGGQSRATTVSLNGSAARSLPSPDTGVVPAVELGGGQIIEDGGASMTAPTSPRPKAPKKLRTPNLDSDLHAGGDPSLTAY